MSLLPATVDLDRSAFSHVPPPSQSAGCGLEDVPRAGCGSLHAALRGLCWSHLTAPSASTRRNRSTAPAAPPSPSPFSTPPTLEDPSTCSFDLLCAEQRSCGRPWHAKVRSKLPAAAASKAARFPCADRTRLVISTRVRLAASETWRIISTLGASGLSAVASQWPGGWETFWWNARTRCSN